MVMMMGWGCEEVGMRVRERASCGCARACRPRFWRPSAAALSAQHALVVSMLARGCRCRRRDRQPLRGKAASCLRHLEAMVTAAVRAAIAVCVFCVVAAVAAAARGMVKAAAS